MEDLGFYGELFSLPDIAQYLEDPHTLTLAQARTRLDRDLAHWQRHGFGRWALSHAGQMVGLGGLTVAPNFAGLKLSYHLRPEFRGQGLASEFVRAAMDYAHDILDSDEVFGLVRPDNTAGMKLLERLDFSLAGTHDLNGIMQEMRAAL